MKENIIILPVLPDTFDYQEYSQADNQLISSSILDTVFLVQRIILSIMLMMKIKI